MIAFIVAHLDVIITVAIFLAGGTVAVIKFKNMTTAQRYEKIQGWLLQAVIWAESRYGGGTGRLKLSAVYAKFCEIMPNLAKVVPFNLFSEYVDDALEEMEHLVKTNPSIAAVASGTEGDAA